MMRFSARFALAVSFLAACDSRVPPRSTVDPARVASDTPDAATVEGPPRRAPRCRLTVTETESCAASEIEQLIGPARARIERCRGPSGGRLRIRVYDATPGKIAFRVEPGSSLAPTERQCVLDALSPLNADESSTAWTGLNVRPTGFSSLLTIEW